MDDVKLSKTLSYLLRHGAVKESLNIDLNGFVDIDEILNHKNIRNKYSLTDIQRVVETNEKHRFQLIEKNGKTYIKANQGHSLKEVNSSGLKPIAQVSESSTVIHGTYFKNWLSIKKNGLSRMTRNHIHLASGLPKDKNVISGMRNNCEVYIYVDANKAIKDGIVFLESDNGVILTPGDERGLLEKKYFRQVIDAKNR